MHYVHNMHAPSNVRTVELTDVSYQRLLRLSGSFDDTAEDVVVRLLDLAEHRAAEAGDPVATPSLQRALRVPSERASPGSILPEREYWPAVLAAIDARGGRAHANEVIDDVGDRLRDRLLPADLDVLAIGEIRWRNRTRFARLRMKEAGLLRSDSPRGIWETTDMGREYLDDALERHR